MHDEGVPMVVSFFTRIPFPGDLESAAKTVYLLPALAFGLAVIPFLISLYVPSFLGSVLSILSIYLVWGAMHLEGLMDFFDGLGGGYKAMKDSRAGSFGVIAAIFVIAMEMASAYPSFALFAISEMGAKLTMLSLLLGKPLGNGLGKFFIERFSIRKYATAWIIAFFLGFLFFRFLALFLLISIPAALIINRISIKKFGGINGDILGAANEIGRTAIMLSMVLAKFLLLE